MLLDRVDLRPVLPDVKQPVLLFCGDLDIVVRPVHAEILLGGLPNALRVVVEGLRPRSGLQPSRSAGGGGAHSS